MSVLVGTPQEIIVPTGLLGNRAIALNNPTWTLFIAGHFLISTSATAGNRIPFFNFRDAAANILFQAVQGGALGGGGSGAHFNIGADIPSLVASPGFIIYIPIPVGLVLPPNAVLFTGDINNIDAANDTISGAFVISY